MGLNRASFGNVNKRADAKFDTLAGCDFSLVFLCHFFLFQYSSANCSHSDTVTYKTNLYTIESLPQLPQTQGALMPCCYDLRREVVLSQKLNKKCIFYCNVFKEDIDLVNCIFYIRLLY